MSLTRRNLLLSAGAAACSMRGLEASAQGAFPSRPVKLVVPFAPGGGGDIVGRLVAPRLGNLLGQPLVIENKTGAGGAIGAQFVAHAAPDGYTALLYSTTMVINPQIMKSTGYNFRTDFIPLSLLASFQLVLCVHPSVPAKTFAEFLAYARSKGSNLFYGSAGNGSTQHLVGELFNGTVGTTIKHVPFKGNGPATASLLAGDIQVFFDIVPSALSYRQSGKLRPLAVTGTKRNPALADLPTLQESGVPNFDFSIWYALFLPKGVPPAIVQDWQRAVQGIETDKELGARLTAQGYEPLRSSSAELAALMERDSARWGKVIADARITTD